MNSINLHGLNLEEAHAKLETGLKSALENREWVIRIIHGQGKHSEVFPVIKSFVRRWLDPVRICAKQYRNGLPGRRWIALHYY